MSGCGVAIRRNPAFLGAAGKALDQNRTGISQMETARSIRVLEIGDSKRKFRSIFSSRLRRGMPVKDLRRTEQPCIKVRSHSGSMLMERCATVGAVHELQTHDDYVNSPIFHT
jgi:hypothetical protein